MKLHATFALTFVVATVMVSQSAQPGSGRLPGQLEDYLTKDVKLTSAQRAQLLAGKPVTQILESDPSHEVSVFGAIWVNAPMSRYVQLAQNVEEFEKGENFRITKRISSPPRADDFERLDLVDEDVADLRTCRVGSCELKLSEAALTRMRKEIDWSKPSAKADAEALANAEGNRLVEAKRQGRRGGPGSSSRAGVRQRLPRGRRRPFGGLP